MTTADYLVGDVFDGLAWIREQGITVDLVMTSPPFLALRSYLPDGHPDKSREIGSEPTPADFIDTMLDVVEGCAEVLAPHGSICFELGDTYSGSGGAGGDYADDGLREGQATFRQKKCAGWPLAKSLTFMPQLFGASLAYGRNLLRPERETPPWRIRNNVAWVRPNPPVGALGDKVRPATSYLTWACKSDRRWFDLDAVRTEPTSGESGGVQPGHAGGYRGITEGGSRLGVATVSHPAGAPPLDWWKISPGGYSGSHYAVFPAELCRIPIEASCPRRVCVTCGTPSRRESVTEGHGRRVHAIASSERKDRHDWNAERPTTTTTTTTGWSTCGCPGTDGIRIDGYHTGTGWRPGLVLDPFGGSGTTLLAATGMSRAAIGIDIDERNADLATERLGMFVTIHKIGGGESGPDDPAGERHTSDDALCRVPSSSPPPHNACLDRTTAAPQRVRDGQEPVGAPVTNQGENE